MLCLYVVIPGRVVTGYRVRDGQWTEIGRIDPQKPQVSIELYKSI